MSFIWPERGGVQSLPAIEQLRNELGNSDYTDKWERKLMRQRLMGTIFFSSITRGDHIARPLRAGF